SDPSLDLVEGLLGGELGTCLKDDRADSRITGASPEHHLKLVGRQGRGVKDGTFVAEGDLPDRGAVPGDQFEGRVDLASDFGRLDHAVGRRAGKRTEGTLVPAALGVEDQDEFGHTTDGTEESDHRLVPALRPDRDVTAA